MAAVVVLHDTEECYLMAVFCHRSSRCSYIKSWGWSCFFFFLLLFLGIPVLFWNCALMCLVLLFSSSLCVIFPPFSIFLFLSLTCPFPASLHLYLIPSLVCVCVDKVFEFLHVFPLASSTVSQLGMFPIFVPCVFNGFLLCFCLSSFVSTLSFGHFDSFLVFLDSRFCIISLISLIKLVLSVNDDCILAVSRMKRNPQWGKKLH